jgi:ABC-type lipoprotein release transport system permease subunit
VKSIQYARRNLWRNRKRTYITLMTLSLAAAVLIVSLALLDGIIDGAVDNITSVSMGEVQVHAPGFLDDRSFYKSVLNPDRVIQAAGPFSVAAVSRSYGYGLISLKNRSSGGWLWGIDPAAEKNAFLLAFNLQKGTFLPETPQKGVVLGRRLARFLQTDTGDDIVMVVQAADGSLGNDLYTVLGILQPSGSLIDRTAAIIHHQDFADLFVSEGRIHQIALTSKGKIPPGQLKDIISASSQNVDIKTWRELLPVFSDLVQVTQATIWMLSIIFVLVAGLGVMNTMLMATHERTWEFGIMKALGTPPKHIIWMVLMEAVILCTLATIIGAGAGTAVSLYLKNAGINVSVFAQELRVSEIIFNPVWRPKLTVKSLVIPVICIWTVCLWASFYPAFLASRLDPVRSMRGNH